MKEEEGLKRRGGAAEEGERVRKMSRLEREEELIRQAMGRKSSRKVGCTHHQSRPSFLQTICILIMYQHLKS